MARPHSIEDKKLDVFNLPKSLLAIPPIDSTLTSTGKIQLYYLRVDLTTDKSNVKVFRRISSVGKRVHKLLFTGKKMPEILSNTDFFPKIGRRTQ